MNDVQERLLSLLERVVEKITSGRFIFTIIVAIVWAYLAITGLIPVEKIGEVTLIVLYAYFTRVRNGNKNGNGEAH